MNFDFDTIRNEYNFPPDFFLKNGLESRIIHEIELFRQKIALIPQEHIEQELKIFYHACLNHIDNKSILFDFKLQFYELLIWHAESYECTDTLYNVISEFKKDENKTIFFNKFPFKANYIFGSVNFFLYQILQKKHNYRYSRSRLDILMTAKYHLLKIFLQNINNKLELNTSQLEKTVSHLSACLQYSSRWFEPIFYLNLITEETKNPNIDYLKATNLNSIKDKTCLDYNGILLLNIAEKCESVLKNTFSNNFQKREMSEILENCKQILLGHKISLAELKEHREKNFESFESLNEYKKFCIVKQLYLNEHSFYCNCKASSKDNLTVESEHEHTQIKWVTEFKPTLDLLVFDFINARKNYYNSLKETQLINFNIQSIGRYQHKLKLKDSFLKTSFKLCYSILDQMAYGILNAMQINYIEHLNKKYLNQKKPNIYFTAIWDEGFFKYNHYKNNPYLIALYTISRDLDRNKVAALKDFKDIRNAFEHKLLFLTNEETNFKKETKYYNRTELSEKTYLLLILTKSAIYSFNNLLRHQSKLFDSEMD